MAPLPENNTAVYFVDYSVGGVEHTFQVRDSGAVSPAGFGATMNAWLNAISTLLFQITVVRIRWRAQGSTVSNIVTTGIEGNTYGTGTPAGDQRADFLNFVGRSSGGRRVTLALFGLDAMASDFRWTSGEDAQVAAAVGIMNAEPTLFAAIDGIAPTWNGYVNTGMNAYWTRQLRS